ncbi:MAG TPA: hypothetical protein VNF27_05135 [Candidatus Binataceae bacterium]|nr:hypothetical protein [Candidatus Binataceae bacterium]
MEHELTDPADLYFNGASNVYNPEIQNALSQVGAQGLSGPSAGNPAGPGASPPSGTSGGLTWQSYQNDLGQAQQVGLETLLAGGPFTIGEAPVAVPAALAAYVVDFLVNFFEDIFGGGSSPPIPRKLMHRRHPLYGPILGIQNGLVPTEASNEGSLLTREDDVGPSSTGTAAGTSVLLGALEAAGAAELAGGGPEDPVADVVSAGTIIVGGAVASYEAYQAYAKGGKQNLSDTGLAPLSDGEITRRAHDPSLSPQERRRYQREEKARRLRNKRKRR